MTKEEVAKTGMETEPTVSLDEYSRQISSKLGSVSGKRFTSLTPPTIHGALSGSGSAICEIGPGHGQNFPSRGSDEEELVTAPAGPAQTFSVATQILVVQQVSEWRKEVVLPELKAMG